MDSSDPTTAYAEAVLAGNIIAGPWVRAACKRHMDMLASQGELWFWDPEAAQHLIDFFPDMLTVEEGGRTVPFYLLDWQVFVAGSLAGWKVPDTGYRLFTAAYIEGGKGSGKSPFAAGIGLYFMIADGELKAEVYSGAGKKEQAAILFQDAVSMVDNSPRLKSRLVQLGKNPVWELKHRPTGSIFKPISSDKKKSGPRPSCALIDELHEHKDRYTVDMLEQGFKGRPQPLLFIITNSGFDRTSICWEWRQNCIRVLEDRNEGDHIFIYIMALDPGDDPLESEECWPKTNPGLGITITHRYLRTQVLAARQIPGRENVVRRLNFCQWTDADVGWMTRETWLSVEEELVDFHKPERGGDHNGLSGGGAAIWTRDEGFDQAECFIGLDLAYVTDMAALAFCFPEGDRLLCWLEYFKPLGHTLADLRKQETKDDAPYIEWIQRGLIHGIPGPVIRMEHIGRRIAEAQQQYQLKLSGYDNYAHKNLEANMVEAGVYAPWVEHPQGFRRGGKLRDRGGNPILGPDGKPVDNPLWMPSSISGFETRILEGTISVQPSPVTRWQVSSVAVREDPAGTGNRVFDKSKAVARIDGVVALAMGVGTADAIFPSFDLSGFLSNPVKSS